MQRSARLIPIVLVAFTAGSALALPGQPGDRQPSKQAQPAGGPRQQQEGRPTPPRAMSPEQAQAAWEAQAKSVAGQIGLDDAKTQAVVKAYVDARKSHEAAAAKTRDELTAKARERQKDGGKDQEKGPGAGRNPGEAMNEVMDSMRKLNDAERAKLKTALSTSLSADQVTKAMGPLGTFDRSWDGMTNALMGFKLDAAKQKDAMLAVQSYVIAGSKARESGKMDEVRETMRAERDTLMSKMKGILSEDQMKEFQASMARGGGQGGRGGRGGGRGPAEGPGGGEMPEPPAGGGGGG